MQDRTAAQPSSGSRRDLKALQLRHEISTFLSSAVADAGTVEGGGGIGSEDIILSVGGEAFHIKIFWDDPATH